MAGKLQANCIAHAHPLRAKAKRTEGDFTSADQDIAIAQELEEPAASYDA